MLLKEFLKQWSHQLQGRGLPTSKCLRRFRHEAQTIRFQHYYVSGSHDESPYAILNVKGNASKKEIKTAFRNLAKQHHPDLNRGVFDDEDNDNKMAKLVNAYETLMSKYSSTYLSDATDSRVALACEIYTVDELRDSPVFDVYSFRISFNDNDHDDTHGRDSGNIKDTASIDVQSTEDQTQLDATPIFPIDAHPQDSISDLKRSIQKKYASAWGLEDRKRDRDGLYLGWELIHRRIDTGDDKSGEVNNSHSVLSYHLFLDSYGIRDGDHLHAIVRK